MKETKEEIVKHLNKYYAEEDKSFFSLVENVILNNPDMLDVATGKWEESCDVVFGIMGVRPSSSYGEILNEEEKKIVRELNELNKSNSRITKKKMVEMMSEILSNDTLLEGFCLSFYESESILEQIMYEFGCLNRYRELAKDEVYLNRRAYIRDIVHYTLAAVNLYGVLHIVDLCDIIAEYDNLSFDKKDCVRDSGTYRETVFFSPEWCCIYTVNQYVGNCIPDIVCSLDGFIANRCFIDAVKENHARFLSYFDGFGKVTQYDLMEYTKSEEPSSYKTLYVTAGKKPAYRPPRDIFLKYEDPDFYEKSKADDKMRQLIKRRYIKEFREKAEEMNQSLDECIDEFMWQLHFGAADYDEYGPDNPSEIMQEFVNLFEDYGVIFENEDHASDFFSCAIDLINSVKLWYNHGYSANEISAGIPASDRAQNSFPSRFDASGKKTGTAQKIYPNDPCPCGSGKKYRKCCGRAH